MATGVAAANVIVDSVVRSLEGVSALAICGHDSERVGAGESQILLQLLVPPLST